MADPGQCDQQTPAEQEQYENRAKYAYEGVSVVITGTTANEITFKAATTSGDVVELTAAWGVEEIMWAPCPSSLPSQAKPDSPGAPPPKDARGILYFTHAYRVGNDLRGSTPKWPKRLAGPAAGGIYNKLKVWPTRIAITGVELANGKYTVGTVDLLNPNLARPGQTITADGEVLELELTASGTQAFKVVFSPFDHLADAVAIIAAAPPHPAKMAAAWTIVATCVSCLEDEKSDKRDVDEHLRHLRRVLPDLDR